MGGEFRFQFGNIVETQMITRGEQMLALRRARMAAAPPFLRGGFRPFFFGGAAWALIALTLWLLALSGAVNLPTHFDTLSWHRHEMLFGFVGAVVAGFLLTAIPNWTGRLPIAGPSLAALFALWMLARLALLFSSVVGPAAAAAIDIGFYLVLALAAAREVLAAKNRNIPVVFLVFLFGVGNALDHAGVAGLVSDPDLGIRAGISLVTLMISLIGGRIVPSFTRNWMAKRGIKVGLPTQPGRFDLGVVGGTAVALALWTFAPEARLSGGMLVAVGLLQAVRLARWGGLRSVPDPLVFILHVGYAWLPIGLVLLGGSILGLELPRSAAIHALTAGGMATMILAVMTRATLGHTGHELKASAPTVFLYGLITLGAVLRVAAPLGMAPYTLAMELSAVAWAGAFLLFLCFYGPILFRSRLGDPAG